MLGQGACLKLTKYFVINIIMDSSQESSFNEANPEISRILSRARQLSVEDEWVKDYYIANTLPQSMEQPKYQQETEYYQEFWKVFLTNEMVITKIKELAAVNEELNTHMLSLEELIREAPMKPKKKRRISAEIEKRFKCPYSGCQKAYGCDVSMNLHIKLKHNGGNKTEREGVARMICEAEATGKQMPEIKIKFPPGYLQKFRASYLTQRGD